MWSRSLNLAKVNADPRKVDVVKRLVSQTVKLANQRETLASRKVKLAETLETDLTHASQKVIVSRKLVVTVTDDLWKGDAHRKVIDVVLVAMRRVVRLTVVVQAMVNGVVSCRGSLRFSTAITMVGSAATNWIA